MEEISAFLKNNQFASGGLLMVVLGGLIAYVRNVPSQLYALFLRFFTVEVSFYSTDEVFFHMERWLKHQKYNNKCKALLATTDRSQEGKVLLIPAYGRHYFIYRNRLVIMDRNNEGNDGGNNSGKKTSIRDRITVRIYSRNRGLAEQILQEARDFYYSNDYDKLIVYCADWGGWTKFSERDLKGTVPILAGNLYDEILNDVTRFLSSKDDYQRLGISYKRGYLLKGPPGGGKTSLIISMAESFKRNICIINLSSPRLSDDDLVRLFTSIPSNSILALEDIDCLKITHDRESEEEKEEDSRVSLGTLLNLLDGILTASGMVVFATTNHADRLDPALCRPGRFDRTYYIDNAIPEQIQKLYLRFFPDSSEEEAKKFSNNYSKETSMAQVESDLIVKWCNHEENKSKV